MRLSISAHLAATLELLLDLSDNCLKQAQFDAVVVYSRKKMDRVGVEPTTSASSL
jgi:hypothetical protein